MTSDSRLLEALLKRDRWIVLGALLALTIVAWIYMIHEVGGGADPPQAGPLPHDIYVWQRAWTPEVKTAVTHLPTRVESLVPLVAEISLQGGETKIVRASVDFGALSAAGTRVAPAIRIAPFPGPFRSDDALPQAVIRTARETVAKMSEAGISPAELQIDFDCADAKLAGYRVWLKAFREALAPLPVCPTALPSWLNQREFANLVTESGRFVLQVHSVAPPARLGELGKLTDPDRVIRWVEQAGKLGVPFRVALPTYTNLVAFGPDRKIRGISAEGAAYHWPADSQVVRWEANPEDLARLIAEWEQHRPGTMTGIIWYRLPVNGDAFNWRWPTLSAVMQGRKPVSRLTVEATDAQPSDIALVNSGERNEAWPEKIEARWHGARLDAADALAGYALDPEPGPEMIRFVRKPGMQLSRLAPNERRAIGWIRCEPHVVLQFSIDEATTDSSADRPVAGEPESDGF